VIASDEKLTSANSKLTGNPLTLYQI